MQGLVDGKTVEVVGMLQRESLFEKKLSESKIYRIKQRLAGSYATHLTILSLGIWTRATTPGLPAWEHLCLHFHCNSQ